MLCCLIMFSKRLSRPSKVSLIVVVWLSPKRCNQLLTRWSRTPNLLNHGLGCCCSPDVLCRCLGLRTDKSVGLGTRNRPKIIVILNSLATLGKKSGIVTLNENMFDNASLGSSLQSVDQLRDGRTKGNTNVRQCLRKVADEHFTAAVKVLCSSGVASHDMDTIKALEAKHPYKPPPSIPSTIYSEPPLIADIDNVLACIKSFPKGTSCWRDGLRALTYFGCSMLGRICYSHISPTCHNRSG